MLVFSVLQRVKVTRKQPLLVCHCFVCLCLGFKVWDAVAPGPPCPVVAAPVRTPLAKSQTCWLQIWASNPSFLPLHVCV